MSTAVINPHGWNCKIGQMNSEIFGKLLPFGSLCKGVLCLHLIFTIWLFLTSMLSPI